VREVERHLRFAGRLGAEVRRKERRHHAPPRALGAQAANLPEPDASGPRDATQSNGGADS
jgi:hypothetical protein